MHQTKIFSKQKIASEKFSEKLSQPLKKLYSYRISKSKICPNMDPEAQRTSASPRFHPEQMF